MSDQSRSRDKNKGGGDVRNTDNRSVIGDRDARLRPGPAECSDLLLTDRPAAVRTFVRELRQARAQMLATDTPCERCTYRMATRVRRRGDGPIQKLCVACLQDSVFEAEHAAQRARFAQLRRRGK
jgi:hypothetical protein